MFPFGSLQSARAAALASLRSIATNKKPDPQRTMRGKIVAANTFALCISRVPFFCGAILPSKVGIARMMAWARLPRVVETCAQVTTRSAIHWCPVAPCRRSHVPAAKFIPVRIQEAQWIMVIESISVFTADLANQGLTSRGGRNERQDHLVHRRAVVHPQRRALIRTAYVSFVRLWHYCGR